MRKFLLILFCIVVITFIGFVAYVRWHWGPGYDPSNSQDVHQLLVFADNSLPLREALERFKQDHGGYPTDVTNLFPSYLPATNAPDHLKDWAGWEYHPVSTNGYSLFYQLEWDGGLWFEHSVNGTNQWQWSTSDRVVDLTHQFQKR
jgi:hypothetical protein